MMKPVQLEFDTYRGDCFFIVGNEKLIIPKFLRSTDGQSFQTVLSPYAQERIIKLLVENMSVEGSNG